MTDFQEFIDKYLAHTIGVIALVQVWLIAAWNKWIIKPKIEFHPTANIEIGFSTFGSTVSLPGAIRLLNKDIFVSAMRLKIVRVADRSEHEFTWRAFKSNKLTGPSLVPENVEIASSFTVSPGSPKILNVFFASENFSDRYAQHARAIQTAWSAFLQAKQPVYGEQFATQLNDPLFVDELFSEFSSQNNVVLDFHASLNNRFFWHSGEYLIELKVSSAQLSDQIYTWSLCITEQEEIRLRSNAALTIKEVCKISVVYEFVYKPYMKVA